MPAAAGVKEARENSRTESGSHGKSLKNGKGSREEVRRTRQWGEYWVIGSPINNRKDERIRMIREKYRCKHRGNEKKKTRRKGRKKETLKITG